MTEQEPTPGRRRVPIAVRLGYPTAINEPGNPAPRTHAHLEVRDVASGVILADVEFGPEQLMDLLRGSTAEAIGEVSLHLERVGKLAEMTSVPIGDVPEAVAEEVALNYRAAGEWDTVRTTKTRDRRAATGFTWHLTLRRWRKGWETERDA